MLLKARSDPQVGAWVSLGSYLQTDVGLPLPSVSSTLGAERRGDEDREREGISDCIVQVRASSLPVAAGWSPSPALLKGCLLLTVGRTTGICPQKSSP